MKYVTAAAGAVLIAATVSAAAPQRLILDQIRQNMFASCFITSQEGWMVGDLGRIFHTADAGRTFELQDAGTKRPFVSLACPEKGHVWAAGQAGQISLSTDSGATWRAQKTGTDRQLVDIAFVNEHRGLAVGDFGLMVRTDDGGATWTKIPLPKETKLPEDVAEVVDPGDVVLSGVAFGDPEHVWTVGEFGVILASTDGGLTWQSQNSPVESTLFGVSFIDAQHGWAVGLESVLLRTEDGGTTWHKESIQTPKGFALALYDIEVRGQFGWAVGNSGFLLNSKDAGVTWQLVDVPVQMGSSWFRGVSLLPDGSGVIVGSRGLVLALNRDQFTPLKTQF